MKKFFLLPFLFAFLLSSCLNEEGEGGTSVVQGKVYKVYHLNDSYSFEADTFPAAKEDVYIVYGNDEIYGDKMETGYDGFFRFSYLRPGKYVVYAYSTATNSQKLAEMDTVTVSNGKTAQTRDIYIHEGKSYNTSYVKGAVYVRYYNKGSAITQLKPGYDIRVYIREKGAPYHFDEIRTSLDGEYMFRNLKVGEYEVFVYTEDPYTEALSPVIQTISVTSLGEVFTLTTPFEIIVTV